MTIEGIMERMSTPWVMTPKEIVHSYMFLVSAHSRRTLEYLAADLKASQLEKKYLDEGMTSSKAKTVVKASSEGYEAVRLKAEIATLQEMIRALKRSQQYFADEARNLV